MVYPADDEEDGFPHVCGKAAVAEFTKANPKKGPREPRTLHYPRCRRHFTDKAIGQAGIEGYEIIHFDVD